MDRKRDWRRRRHTADVAVRALVLEADGFQLLIDTRDLWKPPRVLVRRG